MHEICVKIKRQQNSYYGQSSGHDNSLDLNFVDNIP
jgi:hypothetical protein